MKFESDAKTKSIFAIGIVPSIDITCYTALPPHTLKTEIENGVNMCHRRGCSFLQVIHDLSHFTMIVITVLKQFFNLSGLLDKNYLNFICIKERIVSE